MHVSVCMYVVSTILVLPGGLGQGFPPPFYSNGANNNVAPYTDHTTYSMGTWTNQKNKYTLGSFHGDQTWTEWRVQGGGFWIRGGGGI